MWAQLSKIAGWLLLLFYLANRPLAFEPTYVGLYLAIFIGVSAGYALLGEPLVAYLWTRFRGRASEPGQGIRAFFPHPKNEQFIRQMLRRPIAALLLVPGEDGLFLVPLLLVGITWWTALPVALLFGLAHSRTFSWEQSSVKAVCTYIACLLVLPHGVLNVVVGHLLLDGIALAGIALFMKPPPEQGRSG